MNFIETWKKHLTDLSHLVHSMAEEQFSSESVPIRKAAEELGMKVFELDGRKLLDRNRALDYLSSVFGFPEYFGRNWDATFDLLTDLSWHEHRGVLVVLDNSSSLIRLDPAERSKLVKVLKETAQYWRDERGEYGERAKALPFHVFFITSNPGSILDEVTVCSHGS